MTEEDNRNKQKSIRILLWIGIILVVALVIFFLVTVVFSDSSDSDTTDDPSDDAAAAFEFRENVAKSIDHSLTEILSASSFY